MLTKTVIITLLSLGIGFASGYYYSEHKAEILKKEESIKHKIEEKVDEAKERGDDAVGTVKEKAKDILDE